MCIKRLGGFRIRRPTRRHFGPARPHCGSCRWWQPQSSTQCRVVGAAPHTGGIVSVGDVGTYEVFENVVCVFKKNTVFFIKSDIFY